MEQKDRFELSDDIAIARIEGRMTWLELSAEIESVVMSARRRNFNKLMVVTTDAFGFDRPGVMGRYDFVKRLVRAADFSVRLALVAI